MNRHKQFSDYYRCIIEKTDIVSYQDNVAFHQLGSNDPSYRTNVSTPVYAVYLTEDMLEDLINQTVEKIEEVELRSQDPRLMKMYCEYITMLRLMK